jgi:hypothetical protein
MRAFVVLLAMVLAGCAARNERHATPGVSEQLVQVADAALGTASNTEDLRVALRDALHVRPGERVVLVGGHRFLLYPATLDELPAGDGPLRSPYRWLLAQTLQLAEQSCVRFDAPEQPGWHAQATDADKLTLSASVRQEQLVTVGIELRKGCITALHAEQASPVARQ